LLVSALLLLALFLGVIWLKKEKVAVWDSFKINSLQVFFV